MRGIKFSKILVLIFALPFLCSIFLLPQKTKAANLSSISHLEIEGLVQKNGSLVAAQTITFTEPSILKWTIHVRNIRNLTVQADGQEIRPKYYHLAKKDTYRILTVNKKYIATIWKISFSIEDAIQVSPSDEYLRWQVVSSPETNINFITVTINSPYAFKQHNNYRVITWHGVSSHDVTLDIKNNKKIIYSGEGLGPQSGFTVYAYWPRNTFQFSLFKRTILNLSTMEITFWLVFGLLLPLFAIAMMTIMYWRKRHQSHYIPSLEMVDHPPSNLSPLMVGILFEMKINSHTMLSAILDLCQRGYLVIAKDKKYYAFGRRKEIDDNLRDWEKMLLEELFASNAVWAKEEDIQRHSKEQLFSPKIREIFDQSYENITNLGFFDENPHFVRVKYKIIGIFLYLFSIFGAAWVAFTMQPSYLLIPNIGVLLAAYTIFHLSLYMPIQNKKGFEIMNKWAKFQNYLKNGSPLGASASIGGLFYEYLPYAIALKADKQWMERFRSYHIILPDWYISNDFEITTEHTISHLVIMIERLSNSLNQLKGPSVN